MRINLKDYLARVDGIYKAAAGEIANEADRLEELKAQAAGVWGDGSLTMDGKHAKADKLAGEIHAVDRRIAELQSNARKAALAVRAEVERAFYDLYNAVPADYNEKTVALINSGVLTEKELLHMADGASRTMKRFIGARLAESKDQMTAFNGRVMQQISENPHLSAVDNMIGVGTLATGGGVSGVGGVRGFLDRWDYVTRPVYDDAPNVGYEYDTTTGEGRRFYEGA